MLLAKASFLYVDDHPASQHVMELLLTEVMGVAHLTMFSNSENIIDRLEAIGINFDVIFLDLHMGHEDGFAVHNLLRQHPTFQMAKFVAVTASIVPEELTKIRTTGFDGLILKPLSYESFPQQVENILAGEAVWEGV